MFFLRLYGKTRPNFGPILLNITSKHAKKHHIKNHKINHHEKCQSPLTEEMAESGRFPNKKVPQKKTLLRLLKRSKTLQNGEKNESVLKRFEAFFKIPFF